MNISLYRLETDENGTVISNEYSENQCALIKPATQLQFLATENKALCFSFKFIERERERERERETERERERVSNRK